MPASATLTINSGSSSLKASVFREGQRRDFRFKGIGTGGLANHEVAIDHLLREIQSESIAHIAHRVTDGGEGSGEIALIDDKEMQRLMTLVSRAPLHMPHNLRAIDLCMRFNVPQFACFDSGFHADLGRWNKVLSLPRTLSFSRAGYHGLSFGYIASRLFEVLPEVQGGRVAIAHLGSGSSLCLLKKGRSIETTMGWTPLGGIPMSTRSGDLDPGIVLELLHRYSREEVIDLLWRRSGLFALSGERSAQMDQLLADSTDEAQFAVEYFCRRVSQAIAALAATEGGLDALIFTGGIGENAPSIRSMVCARLGFLGLSIDERANQDGALYCQSGDSAPILRIAADEERQMQTLVARYLAN